MRPLNTTIWLVYNILSPLRITKNGIYLWLICKYYIWLLACINLDNPIITRAKISVQELDIREYKI